MYNIDLIVGARPNFMKVSSIIREIDNGAQQNKIIDYRLIHTGQHYDPSMSASFFEDLNIPTPHVNFDVGSGSQAQQTAEIMIKYEELLSKSPTNLCLVVGDVNSTMACAITAKKLNVPVAHVEAGIRSNDWTMPEEVNRVVTDSISDWFFTTSISASENLYNLGVPKNNIFFVGNTMIDTLLLKEPKFVKPSFWDNENLQLSNYFVLTLHRPSNVDSASLFKEMIFTLCDLARGLPIVYPAHPRTRKVIDMINEIPNNLLITDPLSYLEFNYLVKHAKAVITDSGGITEETTVMKVPCITLRDNTERPETVEIGTNVLAGTNPKNLNKFFDKLFEGNWKKGKIPDKWDGKTGKRIVKAVSKILQNI